MDTDVTEPAHQDGATGADGSRVLIVDDHDLFRTGLRTLLEEHRVQVVGEARNGSDAVRLVRELAPDVVVPTSSAQHRDVMDAIRSGACGYLLKDSSIDDLRRGIGSAEIGESLISPHIAGKVLQRLRATSVQPALEETIRAELSDRETQVLRLIANGKDNAQIAAELHISPKTVKNHISNILMKLQTQNRIQAAVYAVRSGIV